MKKIWKGLFGFLACVMFVGGAAACGDESSSNSKSGLLSESSSVVENSRESVSAEKNSSMEESSSESVSVEESSSIEEEPEQGTEGLEYALSDDGTYYTVTGCSVLNITEIIIPNVYNGVPVTTIEGGAFHNYSSLTNVTIPDSVTTIGGSAFENCSSLTSITIGNGVTFIGNYAFAGCSSLTSITIPDGVTTIGEWTFAYCKSLTSVTIPDSVITIGYSAFIGCSSLTCVTIGDSVTTIGYRAFYNCSSLTSIMVGENNTAYKSIDGNLYTKDGTTLIQYAIGKTATEFVIPDGVTTIERWAFYDCDSLTSVTISNSVTSIGCYAFDSFYGNNLTSVIFEDTEGWKVDTISLSATDLADASTAAKYLTNTYTYAKYNWIKE